MRKVYDMSEFDPETVGLLAEVFDVAWRHIERNGVLAKRDVDDSRAVLAGYIIENAKRGQRDRTKLVEDALFRFSA
jgi:hypothetical protein